MAKKPPQGPKPASDDFDPERELNEDVVPIDDVDDLFAEVVADDGDDATKLVHDPKDHVLPDIEVEAEDVVAEVEADDLFAEVVADDDASATKSMRGSKNQELPEVEVDAGETMAEVEEDSPHETATKGEMPATDGDDPFAGVNGDEGEVVGVGADRDLVTAAVAAEPTYEEEVPKPSLHWFTWTLIALNFVAVLVAPYLLLLDYQKRQQYAYAVFLVDLRALGLPSEEEETSLTAARVTLPSFRISPDEIKRIVKERGFPIGDKFEAIDEQVLRRVAPSALDQDILRDHFEGGELVKTVEAEVRRLQAIVVPDIEKAAQDSFATAKSDVEKQSKIVLMLHPLAMDTYQSKKLEQRIKTATGPELQKLYLEAAQRRMAFDFLLPLELFRPGDAKGLFVETIGDLEALPLDKVLERVNERIKSTIDKNYQPAIHLGEEWGKIERDTIEKRLTISFTLLSLAHVKKPDGDALYPLLLERIPRVMGQYDFALACELFPSRILGINEKVLERIRIDREGFEVANKAGALVRGKAFIDYYEDELQRIRFLQHDIFKAKIRLKDLQDQKTHDEAFLKQRREHLDEVLARIATARAKTEKDAAEMRLFQDELFRYQLELATSEDELNRVHQEIREKLGNSKLGITGGK